MASIHGGSGNELFFHGSTFLTGDADALDLTGATAKYYVCAITIIEAARFGGSGLQILDAGKGLGMANTHFASNEDTQTLDTDWGATTNIADNDANLIVLDGSGTVFAAGTTIYGMYDYVELHEGSAICYVAPRPDYLKTARAAAI